MDAVSSGKGYKKILVAAQHQTKAASFNPSSPATRGVDDEEKEELWRKGGKHFFFDSPRRTGYEPFADSILAKKQEKNR
jgi:hypothetical protein